MGIVAWRKRYGSSLADLVHDLPGRDGETGVLLPLAKSTTQGGRIVPLSMGKVRALMSYGLVAPGVTTGDQKAVNVRGPIASQVCVDGWVLVPLLSLPLSLSSVPCFCDGVALLLPVLVFGALACAKDCQSNYLRHGVGRLGLSARRRSSRDWRHSLDDVSTNAL